MTDFEGIAQLRMIYQQAVLANLNATIAFTEAVSDSDRRVHAETLERSRTVLRQAGQAYVEFCDEELR